MFTRLFFVLILYTINAGATPDIQHWQTARGTRVFFVETHELPMIDVQVVFDAGAARSPEQKRGLALVANSLLSQAAGGLTADQISFEFERLGAEFGADAGYDSAYVSLRSLSDRTKLMPALENLQKLISSPDFSETDLERQRNQLRVAIQRNQQSPGTISQQRFLAAVYQDHPYAFPTEGTAESLAAITRQDLVEFHAEYYTASNAMVTLVGDIDRSTAETIVESITRNLPQGTRPDPVPAVRPLESDEVIRIYHPSSQTHIMTGQPGMRYGDPDYFPLYVGNHILGGGGLVSRLFEEVREKRGLSYTAGSYFAPRRDAGPFLASLQTREDQAEEALIVLKDTISEFITSGPTAEELSSAKKDITGGFPMRIDSNSKISGYLSVIGFYGLPLDYLDRFIERIEAVTVEEIKDAFLRRIHVDKFVTVLVGPVEQTPAGTGD